MSLSKQIGVTRLADITHLDKLTIPNYSAVLPGTKDYIWVYSGKGPTKAHAKASALMECIERYSSLQIVHGEISFKEVMINYHRDTRSSIQKRL